MLNVAFQSAVTIHEADLPELLRIVAVPVLVTPVTDGVVAPVKEKKPRKPYKPRASKAAPAPIEEPAPSEAGATEETGTSGEAHGASETAPAAEKPKRSHTKKETAEKPKASKAIPMVADKDAEAELYARFSKMIEADYDKAAEVLEYFGAAKLSEVKAGERKMFSDKITELGY